MDPALWAPRAYFLMLAFMARQELKKGHGLGSRSLEAGRSLWFCSQVSKVEMQGFGVSGLRLVAPGTLANGGTP